MTTVCWRFYIQGSLLFKQQDTSLKITIKNTKKKKSEAKSDCQMLLLTDRYIFFVSISTCKTNLSVSLFDFSKESKNIVNSVSNI